MPRTLDEIIQQWDAVIDADIAVYTWPKNNYFQKNPLILLIFLK